MEKTEYAKFELCVPVWGFLIVMMFFIAFGLAPMICHSTVHNLSAHALGPCFAQKADGNRYSKEDFSGYSKIVDTLWLKKEYGESMTNDKPNKPIIMTVNGKEYILE
jgi:hypothetical protein